MTTTETSTLPPMPPTNRRKAKPVNTILMILGALVVLTLLITTARSAVASLNREQSTQSLDTAGVTSLEISANSGSFELVYADATEATLEIDSANGSDWKLSRQGDKLVVDSPNSWGNWCFFGCGLYNNEATLILPKSLNDGRLDANFDLAAGDFTAVGAYKNLVAEVGAGELDLSGTAQSAEIHLGAGKAEVSLADVQHAVFDISAGHMAGNLTGTAPQSINAEVSAGSLDLELPDGSYDVRQTVDAGNLTNLLVTDPKSPHKISIELSAGNAKLSSGSVTSK